MSLLKKYIQNTLKKYKKNEKGVTLVALVVTIVVVLIIAGISVGYAMNNQNQASDSSLISEMNMIQNAILQRKTKAELTKDDSQLVGTAKTKAEAESELGDTNITLQGYNYKTITPDQFKDLGITNVSDTYLVDYYTGEVFNITKKTTSTGEALYVYSKKAEYVSDGLILHYDGIDNTGNGHDSTATIWKDLSGNGNDGNIYGGVWNESNIQLNGSGNYIQPKLNKLEGDYTIEILANTISLVNSSTYAPLYMINKQNWTSNTQTIATASTILWWGTDNNICNRFLVSGVGTIKYSEVSAGYSNIEQKDKLFTVNKTNEKINVYVGSSKNGEITDSDFMARFNFYDFNLVIGQSAENWGEMKQNVDSFRIYNRALSADEIANNYTVDKARFNIQE